MIRYEDYLPEIAAILGPNALSITEDVVLTFLRLSAASLLAVDERERDRIPGLLLAPRCAGFYSAGAVSSHLDTECGAQVFGEILLRLTDDLKRKRTEEDALGLAQTMIGLYEPLVDVEIAATGENWRLETVPQTRRQKGCYYTPLQLTRATTAAALNRLVSSKKSTIGTRLNAVDVLRLRIVDPAMGAGAFLVSALDYLWSLFESQSESESVAKLDLAGSGVESSAKLELSGSGAEADLGVACKVENNSDLVWAIAENCLYGVDLDPLAREAARIALWLYCAKVSGTQKPLAGFLEQHLKCGDSLISAWSHRLAPGDVTQLDYDNWCARFFWPAENVTGRAETVGWAGFAKDQPAHAAIVEALTQRHHFFHWELEFPEVFAGADSGFDAVVSNPPWEITKPNAREFFSSADSSYKAIGKSEADRVQEEMYKKDLALQDQWVSVNEEYRARASYFRDSGIEPGQGPKSARHVLYSAQGTSDLNAYKLFLELGFALLKSEGCLAMLVPAGVYTDKGAAPLRRLLMEQSDIYELRSFINRDRAFAIHSSFNFCMLALQRDTQNDSLAVSFSNTNGATLGYSDVPSIAYQKKDVQIFSPKWRTIVEVEHERDLDILRKLYAGGAPLGSSEGQSSWQVSFRREFDLTNDSPSFVRRVEAEAKGYIGDEFGNWLKGNWQNRAQPEIAQSKMSQSDLSPEPGLIVSFDRLQSIRIENVSDILLPLYEGRMLGQFDCNQKQYVSGSGRTAVWKNAGTDQNRDNHANAVKLAPQYLLPLSRANGSCDLVNLKTGYLAVGSPTNARTMIASALNAVPCGNSVPVFLGQTDPSYSLGLLACLNSFVFDYVLRLRMSGNNINYYLLEECPLPSCGEVLALDALVRSSALLSLGHVRFAPHLLSLSRKLQLPSSIQLTPEERVQNRCLVDAVVAYLFRLEYEEYAWILRNCQENLKGQRQPGGTLSNSARSLPLKGFWRVDKNEPSASRLPARCLKAYAELLEHGLPEFLSRMNESSLAKHGQDVSNLGPEGLQIFSSNLQALLQVSVQRARQAAI
jgi:hypothetical protein